MLYINGQFSDDPHISALDRGFVFGDGVYEVWRVLRGQLFEAERHHARLLHGLAALRIAVPEEAPLDRLRAIAERLFAANGLLAGEATLYVEITRGAAPRTHYFPPAGTAPTMLVIASPFTPGEGRTKGVRVITQPDTRWLRCELKTVQLLPNVLARQAALEAGAAEAILVRDGVITEGTHTTVFGVIGSELRTHPPGNLVLPGVTRELVIEFARASGRRVREEAITVSELPRLKELFLTGTTTDITPVVAVDRRSIGNGKPGPVAHALLEQLLARMSGERQAQLTGAG